MRNLICRFIGDRSRGRHGAKANFTVFLCTFSEQKQVILVCSLGLYTIDKFVFLASEAWKCCHEMCQEQRKTTHPKMHSSTEWAKLLQINFNNWNWEEDGYEDFIQVLSHFPAVFPFIWGLLLCSIVSTWLSHGHPQGWIYWRACPQLRLHGWDGSVWVTTGVSSSPWRAEPVRASWSLATIPLQRATGSLTVLYIFVLS